VKLSGLVALMECDPIPWLQSDRPSTASTADAADLDVPSIAKEEPDSPVAIDLVDPPGGGKRKDLGIEIAILPKGSKPAIKERFFKKTVDPPEAKAGCLKQHTFHIEIVIQIRIRGYKHQSKDQ